MIRIECNTWEELIELAGKIVKEQKTEQKEVKAEQKEVKAEPKPATTSAPDLPPFDPAPAPAKTVSRQDVQTKAIALMDTGKKAQLQELLKKYNVQALPSIPEDRLAAFMADMEAM